jgi:hypothetical protein
VLVVVIWFFVKAWDVADEGIERRALQVIRGRRED